MASSFEDTWDDILRDLFFKDYTNLEMQTKLHYKGISMSSRSIKRHLRRLGLRQRGRWSTQEIVTAIQEEIKGSGQNLGYRSLTKRLLTKHGMAVGRKSVSSILRQIDPKGVELRTHHCLIRRTYYNKGPNFLVHIDGYDKLKPFGLAIHGAICGFSRRVLWLKVARTNNDPRVVASYFLEFVEEINGVPRCIRADGGTENGSVEDMQKALRWYDDDDMSGEKSVIIGSSTSNQRIERWWRSMRQMGIGFWIDFFKDLEYQGLFSNAIEMHIECLRFCFTKIIQQELNQIRHDWNHHNIRMTSRQPEECPSGKPEMMYLHPELYGTVDYKFSVKLSDVESLKSFCSYPSCYGCIEEMKEHFTSILLEGRRSEPINSEDAKELFQWMLQKI
ncbi:uncharacterized protein LOC117339248 isoform X1 [Pecten maximus]|uniref:uncharacterized protein LOC117339248 isoform X1 n=1 Tax=Pecten maximus TaxID=6579 RepID=UPI001458AB1C|nr:uncharacterized protein LOC117339248 isoform X1 [Pecten maximus]